MTWVKSDKTIRNAPPDFVVNCNVLDGIFSLRIKDVFLQDSGVYICEAYGFRGEEGADKADLICWCNVEVIGECFYMIFNKHFEKDFRKNVFINLHISF